MQTQDLISNLTKDLRPVKVIRRPVISSIIWLFGVVIYVALLAMIIGLRPDLSEKLNDGLYISELVIVALASATSLFAANFLSVPDSYQKDWIKRLALMPFILLSLFLAVQLISPELLQFSSYISETASTYECAFDMLVFSILPLIALLIAVRKGATTQSLWCSAMIALAGVNISYFSLRIIEPNDMATHLVFWHYLPMLAIVSTGVLLGRKLLSW